MATTKPTFRNATGDVLAAPRYNFSDVKVPPYKYITGDFYAQENTLDGQGTGVYIYETLGFTDVSSGSDPDAGDIVYDYTLAEVVPEAGIPVAEKGAALGVATLDANMQLVTSQLPDLAITDVFVVANQAEMLALSSADTGDVAIRTDINKTFILSADDASVLSNWKDLLTSPTITGNLIPNRIAYATGSYVLGDDSGLAYDPTNAKVVVNRVGYNAYTTAQRNALTAAAGDQIYNSTTGRMEVYDGGAWHGRVRLDGDTMTGDLTVTKGTGTATGKVSNVLNVNTTTQATTGTSEQVLATYTLPANTLNVNGKAVRVTVWGTSAANSNPKVYRIYLGSTIVAGSTNNVSGTKWMAVATIVRTGASAEVSNAFTQHGATGWVDHIALSENTATDLAITMKATTATATGDLTFQGMIVEALN